MTDPRSTDHLIESTGATVVVFTGGDPLRSGVAAAIPDAAMVIAADSGLDHALSIDVHVDLVIGDLDSVRAVSLEAAEAAGATVERHPEAKDRTDLELALDRVLEMGASRVVVVGGHGGRVDHFIANAMVLASPTYASLRLEALVGGAHLHVVRDRADLAGGPGDLVTLMPVHGAAEGVRTEGLLYPLDGETLTPGSTRGVSNELVEPRAVVHLGAGVLLAVQPGERGTHLDSFVRSRGTRRRRL